MTILPVDAAYRLWSATYDSGPNPILALEERVLRERLAIHPGMRVLDLATGTGRWLEYAVAQGAQAFGVDVSREMLIQAARKVPGRLVRATVDAIPFPSDFADLAICSFALGYFANVEAVFRELARTAIRVIVSDLHPVAMHAGWTRSFRADGQKYEIANHKHSRSFVAAAAVAVGLRPCWSVEASFGESEREIFEWAGKNDAFENAARIPAILISCWERA